MRRYGNSILSLFCWIFLLLETAFAQNHDIPHITGSLTGRLGNCLFGIATTCAVAWDNGVKAYFPDLANSYYRDLYKNVLFRCPIKPRKKIIDFRWHTPNFGYEPIPYQPYMQISGYSQNEKYFAHHRDQLLELFAPHPETINYIQKKYKNILKHPQTVSVHVRYYAGEVPDLECFIQYDEKYYEKAMALFPQSSLFVVTSDNMAFAKSIIAHRENVIFVKEPYYIDFALQSLCKHNIISNSTFSWWSAWLNKNPDKIVVRPEIWLGGYPDIGGPDEWIKIKN